MIGRALACIVARCRRKSAAGTDSKSQRPAQRSTKKSKARAKSKGRGKRKPTKRHKSEQKTEGEKSTESTKKDDDAPVQTTSAIEIALDLTWEEEWGVSAEETSAAYSDPNGLGADLVQSIVRCSPRIVT